MQTRKLFPGGEGDYNACWQKSSSGLLTFSMQNPIFLMKVLFVFVFTGFHGGEKALPKLGFAAFIHQFYCARVLFLLAVWSTLEPSCWRAGEWWDSVHSPLEKMNFQLNPSVRRPWANRQCLTPEMHRSLYPPLKNPFQLGFAGLETMSHVQLIPVFHSVQTGELHKFSHLYRFKLFPKQPNPIQRLS